MFSGSHNMLVLCVDPTEQMEGVGAVDMAFNIQLNDGVIGDITPIYPRGMYDPSLTPPQSLVNEGVNHWYLHDSLWTTNLEEGASRAQQIIQYNTGLTSDMVMIVTPDTIDAIINSVGPVYSNGHEVTTDSLSFLRSDQKDNGATRGDSIENLAEGILCVTRSNGKKIEFITTITGQYTIGNIMAVPPP